MAKGLNTCSMLIVKIDIVDLEVDERLFTGLPYVFRLSVDGKRIFVEGGPEFGTKEHFAPEIGILEQYSQESLVFSLFYPRYEPLEQITKARTHHRGPVNLELIIS